MMSEKIGVSYEVTCPLSYAAFSTKRTAGYANSVCASTIT